MTGARSGNLVALNDALPATFSIYHDDPNTLTIDGGTASGKSTLAYIMKGLYSNSCSRVQVVSIDWFLNPRRERAPLYAKLEAGEITIEEYHANTWDLHRFDLLIEQLVAALGRTGEQNIELDSIADRHSGESIKKFQLEISGRTFLILEGIGVLHPHRRPLPGPRIWVEAPSLDEVIERKFRRSQLRDHSTTRLLVASRYRKAEAKHDSWMAGLCKDRADWLYVSNSSGVLTFRDRR
ncbi:MAG: hypothetical protein M3Z24_14955 [Chloroflexota bacterium]|nr:hypothetical protein [Chloroflexota bacterium]